MNDAASPPATSAPPDGSPPFFPIFLRLAGARVMVVGGGEVAARKLRLLARAGPELVIVARELNAEVEALVARGRATWPATAFTPALVVGCRLVVAATDDAALNRAVAAAADAAGVPVNVVDDPAHCSFITPAIIDRSPVTIAIGSGGDAPVLVRRLRERIEASLPAATGRLAAYMGSRRAWVKAWEHLPQAARRALWERFLDGAGAERVLAGDYPGADAALDALGRGTLPPGEVWLVGAGPGDPELLTLRALRLMQSADVVLHDRLVSPEIMELVRRDAERIDVGKRASDHALPQPEISAELVRQARLGRRVLRLKGGDPFVFGRGGEEIAALADAGIPFQVVPAVSAAQGCGAYAGIPLTHRDHAQSCVFVTGHPKASGELTLPWDSLARRGQTVVIYMGANRLGDILARLVEHGLPADWPVALIVDGTTPRQRVVTGTLATLPALVEHAERAGGGLGRGPRLIIVGTVVTLAERLRPRGGPEAVTTSLGDDRPPAGHEAVPSGRS